MRRPPPLPDAVAALAGELAALPGAADPVPSTQERLEVPPNA